MTGIRLSPSGPVIGNTAGGDLSFGPGARLRLVETNSPMSGALIIPTVPDVLSPFGFGDVNAIVLSLPTPKAELEYRGKLVLDVQNQSTNLGGQVILYLDVSVDGGATYTNRVANAHECPPAVAGQLYTRQCEVWMPLLSGEFLGVITNTTPSIKLRARAQRNSNLDPMLVSSLASTTGIIVGGLAGSIHMELEEAF